ncbi:hypothetical protein [Phenylobacterium aquaticum]|jgi:hypothetical protein|uniref:hypothetical protein n=1 Tax=Phenylobacterium aquaticum TaxID=1763816 RepID=UPI0026F22A00|nr:hypothetical protein [Phenylobacterium aquaticum]
MTLETSTSYPDTGLLAVAARLAFGLTALAIVLAVIAPGWLLPKVLHSHYLEHFAAYYIAAVAGAAAMPRIQIRRIGIGYALFALGLEGLQLARGIPHMQAWNNAVADLGGVAAALFPVVVERFRARFAPRPKA